jgi:hypothetical protein
MESASPLHFFRRWHRRFAFLALLAICLHLVAMGIGNFHAARHAGGDHPDATAGETCHGMNTAHGMDGSVTDADDKSPPHPFTPGGPHCPFCASSTVVLIADAIAVAGLFPEPARVSIPPTAFDLPPAAPDLRHAPPRAPPVSSFA